MKSQTLYKVLMSPVYDLDTGKCTFSFFEEFNTLSEAIEFIEEEKLTDFRIVKYQWEDITNSLENKK